MEHKHIAHHPDTKRTQAIIAAAADALPHGFVIISARRALIGNGAWVTISRDSNRGSQVFAIVPNERCAGRKMADAISSIERQERNTAKMREML